MRISAFQQAVGAWMKGTFTRAITLDRTERADRFLEESLELLQANNYSKERALALVDYVYSRPVGEARQELGGVMVTVAAYANALHIPMEIAALDELTRCWDKQELIREKQKAKPSGSALPQ